MSYPKTRVRASRLLEAAFILAIAELTRRLHQAYAQAYDKQAADKVLPQNPGFLIGRFGFNADETERLKRAYDKITSDECRKFFDETLARMNANGEIHSQYHTTPTTLAGVLAITTLNRYSSTLTAAAVGVSQSQWDNVRNRFENPPFGQRYAGVTLGGDGRVFLGDHAFYQPGPIAQMVFPRTDLPGVIVHEFFHRAGLNEPQVTALKEGIQKNCGNPRDAL